MERVRAKTLREKAAAIPRRLTRLPTVTPKPGETWIA